MFDANVALDAFQQREPHHKASAQSLSKSLGGEVEGCYPAHVITTIYYVLRKSVGQKEARESVRWLVTAFEVAPCDGSVLVEAAQSDIPDFEDAVVAFGAQRAGCEWIVTRNVMDFGRSPIPAITPGELLRRLVSF